MISIKTSYSKIVPVVMEYNKGFNGGVTMADIVLINKAARKLRDYAVEVEEAMNVKRQEFAKLKEEKAEDEILRVKLDEVNAETKVIVEVEKDFEFEKESLVAFVDCLKKIKVEKMDEKNPNAMFVIEDFIILAEEALK